MREHYNFTLSKYDSCSMSNYPQGKADLIRYTHENPDRFLNYKILYSVITEEGLSKDSYDYITNKYTNIKRSLRREIASLDHEESFDNMQCVYCMQKAGAKQIEHVLPEIKYPEYGIFIPNLVASCPSCNTKKLDKYKVDGKVLPHPRYEPINDIKIIIEVRYNNVNKLFTYDVNSTSVVSSEKWLFIKTFFDLDNRWYTQIVKSEMEKLKRMFDIKLNKGISEKNSIEMLYEKYKNDIEDGAYESNLHLLVYTGMVEGLEELLSTM